MKEIKWSIGSLGEQTQKDKIEYVPTMRNNPKATDAERESTRLWNLMVNTLRDNGLMKEKGEG
ncbi:hypothetical protein ACFQ3J_00390 [Paenibacillus provencensis]|uniref:Uncharacterized protein n=1 Tax=Paenibacillus provencensis TaxID=441151 RepID=A0ABW3PS56_9BACL|nr:hypothetical protein [Paenibacillus sp. MER 78]MCM3130948.1 hypothetical protein [Paenibacillus sp. MER 78]